jgi:GT2 family glycosyltransferase
MTDNPQHGISVIIPVKGRVALLTHLLASLAEARSHCTEPTEVIVVDDSDPEDARRHRESCARHDGRYLPGPLKVGAKRNVGACAARYDILVFIDSDCEADSLYLATIAKALRDSPQEVGAVAGPVDMIGEKTSTLRLFRHTLEMHQPFAWPREFEQITWAATANFAVRADVFRAVGGFAEDPLTVVGGEDVDLGIRIVKAGHVTRCVPDAVIYHRRETGDRISSISRRLYTYGRSSNWLNRRHPERRQFRLNPVSAIVFTSVAAFAADRATKGHSLWTVPAVAASLLGVHAARHARGDDGVGDIPSMVVSTLLDWSFDAGEFVGAFQVGRPNFVFSRFGYMDEDTFRPREEEHDD